MLIKAFLTDLACLSFKVIHDLNFKFIYHFKNQTVDILLTENVIMQYNPS